MDFIIENGVVKDYTGKSTAVIVPDGVYAIGSSVFQGRNDIVSVELPDSVVAIGSWAFAECATLASVRIPGCAVLGDGAFYRCGRLKALATPTGLKEIGSCAFFGCDGLTSDFLESRRFDLHTYIGHCASDGIIHPNDADLIKTSYSWKEYKTITSEISDYALICVTEEYDELQGRDSVFEVNVPIKDDMIVVADGRFLGCLLEQELTFYENNKLERQGSLVLLKPGRTSVRIQSLNGNHCAFDMYSHTDALWRRYDDPDQWVGNVNVGRRI